MNKTAVKIQGLTSLLDRLADGINRRVDDIAAKAGATEAKADTVMSGAVEKVIKPIDSQLDEVNLYLDDLAKASNGGE